MEKIVLTIKDLEKAKTGDVLVYNAENNSFSLVAFADYNKKLYDENRKLKKELVDTNKRIDELSKKLVDFSQAVDKKLELFDKLSKQLIKE